MKIDIPDKFLKKFINMVSFGENVPAVTFNQGEEAVEYSKITDHIFKEIQKEKPELFEKDEEHDMIVPKNDKEISEIINEYDYMIYLESLVYSLTENDLRKKYGNNLNNMSEDEYKKIFEKRYSELADFVYDEGVSSLYLDLDFEV